MGGCGVRTCGNCLNIADGASWGDRPEVELVGAVVLDNGTAKMREGSSRRGGCEGNDGDDGRTHDVDCFVDSISVGKRWKRRLVMKATVGERVSVLSWWIGICGIR